MIYHLSGRQRKELANGKMLCIALPIESMPAGGEAGIRRLIELPPGTLIIRPIESTIRVRADQRASGMSTLLGSIVQDDVPAAMIELSVNVVSLHIAARSEQRGSYPTQWPGSVTLDDGRTMP